MTTEMQSLQNMADVINLTVNHKFEQDKRRTINKYYATKNRTCVSPILPYDQFNHFLLGWLKCTQSLTKQ